MVFELRLWFSAKGARNRAVDPELIPFSRYQDAVYPWPSSEDLPPEGDEP
ncbi:MAG: hypothetical protein JKY65_22180 [Planctomycetes bacterium]|nr:hypothetical protein [Planctomycetota bacterium]